MIKKIYKQKPFVFISFHSACSQQDLKLKFQNILRNNTFIMLLTTWKQNKKTDSHLFAEKFLK